MDYEYDLLFVIGRFQPVHLGHMKIFAEALHRSRRLLILIGSSNKPRSFRNPFTFEERAGIIEDATHYLIEDEFADRPGLWIKSGVQSDRLDIQPLNDHPYNDKAWMKAVQTAVKNNTWQYETADRPQKVGMIGYAKDHTSYYQKLFPDWGSVDVPLKVIYNATDIRNEYFTRTPKIARDIVPEATATFMKGFLEHEEFRNLVAEREYIAAYRKSWEAAPYPPTFLTADAVVTQGANILLIQRKASPGRGLLALPGGFLDPHETLLDGAIRELVEETRIKVTPKVLRGSLKKSKVYDDPNRSDRGRTVTQAFHFDLEPQLELPRVKGSSDAGKAFWAQIANLDPRLFFEDHHAVILDLLSLENTN